MRLREVKKGMEVKVKKLLKGYAYSKAMLNSVGKKGKVVHVYYKTWEGAPEVYVSFGRGSKRLCFHHRELKEVK